MRRHKKVQDIIREAEERGGRESGAVNREPNPATSVKAGAAADPAALQERIRALEAELAREQEEHQSCERGLMDEAQRAEDNAARAEKAEARVRELEAGR